MRIDIGSGGGKRPAKGYNVYTDIFMPDRPPLGRFVVCPMEDMSCFKDKEFDYARCHHVIEHVNDPEKACNELMRIAKAGIIAFPTAQAEIMFGRPDHNWFVFAEVRRKRLPRRLLFIKKRHPSYGVLREVTWCETGFDFEWEDSFEWQIIE